MVHTFLSFLCSFLFFIIVVAAAKNGSEKVKHSTYIIFYMLSYLKVDYILLVDVSTIYDVVLAEIYVFDMRF